MNWPDYLPKLVGCATLHTGNVKCQVYDVGRGRGHVSRCEALY